MEELYIKRTPSFCTQNARLAHGISGRVLRGVTEKNTSFSVQEIKRALNKMAWRRHGGVLFHMKLFHVKRFRHLGDLGCKSY